MIQEMAMSTRAATQYESAMRAMSQAAAADDFVHRALIHGALTHRAYSFEFLDLRLSIGRSCENRKPGQRNARPEPGAGGSTGS